MSTKSKNYVSALRFDALTRIYDPLIAATLKEKAFKSALVDQARVEAEHRVLDLACGTATLTMMIKEHCAGAAVTGVDGDPKILAIARDKVDKAGLEIALDEGLSFDLPYADASFDRVVSSLFFHHLTSEDKARTATELFRVLKPGGELHVADWGKPQNILMAAAFQLVRILDGFHVTSDNFRGLLPSHFERAGFEAVQTRKDFATILGTIALYSARKPE